MSTWSGGRTLGTVAILFSFLLVGCAARLGSEALTPVAASVGGKTMQIYVATTRERNLSQNVFTANLANALNFPRFSVSVPPNHKSGNIEMPTTTPDPERDFAVVDRAALSESEFRQAVTLKTTPSVKSTKFLFSSTGSTTPSKSHCSKSRNYKRT